MNQFTDEELYDYIEDEWQCPVDVDFENLEVVYSEDFQDGRLVLFYVGGDWQWPVYFAAVNVEDRFVIYLPEKGNVYYKNDMVAHDSDDGEYPLTFGEYNHADMVDEARNHFKLLFGVNKVNISPQVERIEELETCLNQIKHWCNAYPLDIFPEPDMDKAAKLLNDGGMSLDSISASNMRHVLNGIVEIIDGVV